MAASLGLLYLRCVGWGLVAGAVSGAGTFGYASLVGDLDAPPGASLGTRLAEAVSVAIIALPYGMALAAVPALVGGLIVLSIAWASHPHPALVDAVRRDLRIAAYGLTATLAGAVLFASMLDRWGSGRGDVLRYVLVTSAWLSVVLWPASASLARAWAAEGQAVSPALSGRPKGSW